VKVNMVKAPNLLLSLKKSRDQALLIDQKVASMLYRLSGISGPAWASVDDLQDQIRRIFVLTLCPRSHLAVFLLPS